MGINLTSANRVVLFDVSWNPAHDIESLFRVYRYGQKRSVYIYRLVSAGTMEEKVFNRQLYKQTISKNILDGESIKRNLNLVDIGQFFNFKEDPYVVSLKKAATIQSIHQDDILKGLLSRLVTFFSFLFF